MVRINARTSLGTVGRPGLPCRTFQAQNNRKPFRCQPMTVDALTTKMLDCQSFQTAHSQAHKNRSAGVSFGRLTERCRTPSWWRRARISSCSAARLRTEAKTAAQRADNRYLKGNRGENGNSQFINQIGICENHSWVSDKIASSKVCISFTGSSWEAGVTAMRSRSLSRRVAVITWSDHAAPH